MHIYMCSVLHGMGEHGAESIHAQFNGLNILYATVSSSVMYHEQKDFVNAGNNMSLLFNRVYRYKKKKKRR